MGIAPRLQSKYTAAEHSALVPAPSFGYHIRTEQACSRAHLPFAPGRLHTGWTPASSQCTSASNVAPSSLCCPVATSPYPDTALIRYPEQKNTSTLSSATPRSTLCKTSHAVPSPTTDQGSLIASPLQAPINL
ncbi:hypothetical protein Micbo1qcDRAFT_10390 [Microdochium bolleyi]|uniref:Uncharacterized protein n=1 Tax=Microdochium bolleyi TaxID=196109 RepID=A0A136IYA0_9PEZI|nr:hypothetical protein Micbo1qcDRAFT_10390 [Microdochium bolleyi]